MDHRVEVKQGKSVSKAIKSKEGGVKEKHVMTIVTGTFQEHGASSFWNSALRLPIKENAVACWKFCFVLHKVLREGHARTLQDSQKYSMILQVHGEFWAQLKPDYGLLVKLYCDLLNFKLSFHDRNKLVPGNLEVSYEDLILCERYNEDEFFQLSLEMLDYLDAILELQREIFTTIEALHSKKPAKSSRKCVLIPINPLMQDSIALYSHTVEILLVLHEKLSRDLLEGHRQRLYKVFAELVQVYKKVGSLHEEDIHPPPLLSPPNFLIQDKLDNYEQRNWIEKEDSNGNIHCPVVASAPSYLDLLDVQRYNETY